MPELPEVYTMVKGLKTLIGRKIKKVWADKPRVLNVLKKVDGRMIESIERRGKNVIFNMDKNLSLLIHPKMTGIFLINKIHPYQRAVLNLLGGDFLTFSDKRRFARIAVFTKSQINQEFLGIGADALKISFKDFKNLVSSKKGKIKQVLMDQSVVAGIGNIYADEILWKAKVYPERPSDSLSASEIQEVFKAMGAILKKSIKLRGVSIQDYRDVFGKVGEYQNHRLVYGRAGEKCKRCEAKIERIKISQRSAHFCPKCQI